MNSCLYECQILHWRRKPKEHKLAHKIFMFYLDLDEIPQICRNIQAVNLDRFNFYTFSKKDHIDLGGPSVKENIGLYLKSKGIDLKGGRIMLLTNLRMLGYNFNPVSFYFCFDDNDQPACVVAEIGNTFGELKPYLISRENFQDNKFSSRQTKHYYISPFMDLDMVLDFKISIPNEKLNIRIDTLDGHETILYATMLGQRRELSAANLFWNTVRFPFVTLKIIGLIHCHAALLWLKRLSYHKKEDNPDLQKEVFRAWRKN